MVVQSQKQRWAARADRYDAWAVAAEAKAQAIYAARPECAHDPAFQTQPARSSQGVARARRALAEREQNAWKLEQRAKEYREKAENLRALAARNAGDAERARADQRAALDAVLHIGDEVITVFGRRRVTKINAKTIRVEGVSCAIDKSLCRRISA